MAASDDIMFSLAKAGDIPVIQDLASRIWREHYPGIITRKQIEYMLEKMYAAEVILDEIANQRYQYVLAVEHSGPIGFIAFVYEPECQAVKISKLYVLPSRHGQGVGRKALHCAREAANRLGAKTLYLYVNKNNRKAITAYERFGMVKASAVVTDIGGGFVMDDYRMEMRL